jgi:hypothetical protein
MSRTRWAAAVALSVVLAGRAFGQESGRLTPVTGPMAVNPPPGCVPGEALAPEEVRRLMRFAVVPGGYGEWKNQNCYPRFVDDASLGRTTAPVGIVISVAGRDALVVDVGTAWLEQCRASGLSAVGPDPVTGSELLTVLEAIARSPTLAAEDIREIGLAKGRHGGGAVYALYLGTVRREVLAPCFDDLDGMIAQAEARLSGSAPAR